MDENCTLYASSQASEGMIFFVPGMACNRFGHPYLNQPSGLVADIVAISKKYDIFFIDIHSMKNSKTKFHIGTTVEQQSAILSDVVHKIMNKNQTPHKVFFISQSLGVLATLHYLIKKYLISNVHIVAIAPPTYEGIDCRQALAEMFIKNECTTLDCNCVGMIQYGDNQTMEITEKYWKSIESNSLLKQINALRHPLQITILYATDDKYFKNNVQYLQKLPPSNICSVPIKGGSHTFKTPSMRKQAIKIIKNILSDA